MTKYQTPLGGTCGFVSVWDGYRLNVPPEIQGRVFSVRHFETVVLDHDALPTNSPIVP
jgi:hypothetical protein